MRTAEPAIEPSASCVYVAFTCNGLRALGIDEAALSTFPEAFQVGMPARAEVLGDHGASHLDHWEGGLASPGLHTMLVLFARDRASRERRIEQHRAILATYPSVCVLSTLDVAALATGREHFDYRDGITLIFVYGDTRIEAEPDTFIYGPRNIPHGLRVAGSVPVRVLEGFLPPGLEQFFIATGEPITDQTRLQAEPGMGPPMRTLMDMAAKYHIEMVGPIPE